MDQSKNSAEMSGQAPSVYYQPQGPAPPPGYYGQPPPGQQQPYVVVQQPQPTVVVMGPPPGKSYALHMALACCTFWCCGALFGIVAFIIALIAHNTSSQSPQSADRLGKISVALSVIGIIVGIIVIVYYVIQIVTATKEVYHFVITQNGTTWNFSDGGNTRANATG